MSERNTTAARWALLPPLLLLVVLGLDSVQQGRSHGVVLEGLLDEPAHLATAALVLLAVRGCEWLTRHRSFTVSALFCSMAIDVDHLPLYAGVPHWSAGGRPFTHCLLTVAVLALAAAVWRTARPMLLGGAAGVLLHFVRDLATGPGLPLLWPATSASVRVDYLDYVALLVVLLLVAEARVLVRRRSAPGVAPDPTM